MVSLVLAIALQDVKLSSDEKKQAREVILRYFKEEDLEKRDAILAELEPIDHPSRADIASIAKDCLKWMKAGPIVDGKSPATCTDPAHKGTYIIEGASKGGKPQGLFISLHGGGDGVGDGSQIKGLFGTPAPGMINVYPTVTEKTATAWNTEREEQYVLSIVRELKRTYAIDTNRVYVAGHSMGGFGAWSIAGRHADLFAAASAMAGGTYGPGVIPNYKNLPLWFFHSKDDAQVGPESDVKAAEELEKLKGQYGPYEFVWKLYDDIGHGLPKEGVQPIFTWMLKRVRKPYPERVVWQPSRKYKKLFYWLRLEDAGGDQVIEAERKGNTITVTGSREGLWVYLSEEMVESKKPVIVKDGDREVYSGAMPYSLVALVDSLGRNMDPQMYFVGRVKVR